VYLWQWFNEIFYLEPLSFTEINAWSNLTNKNIRGWEAQLIYEMSRFV